MPNCASNKIVIHDVVSGLWSEWVENFGEKNSEMNAMPTIN